MTTTGQCGTFQYPPPFLALVAPFTLLQPAPATWAWIAACAACVPLAVLLMPVPLPVRLLVLLLAGTSWPVLFAIKVGALGPLLLVVFAAAWRWMDRPGRLAVAAATGTFAKLQPAILVPWMLLTGRWRGAVFTCAGLAAVAGAWFLVQPQPWLDFLAVERTISGSALEVPANLAPASVAYFQGVAEPAARLVGLIHAGVVLGLVVLAALRLRADASFVIAAVASQVVAPVMWDHYAVVAFLPIAWLLARRQWWVLVPGLAVNAMFVAVFPASLYVVVLDALMVGTAVVAWMGRKVASTAALP